MTIYAHDDKKFWGRQVCMAAGRIGAECVLFSRAEEVPEGARAFVRLDQQQEQRDLSKGLVARLAARRVKTLPTAAEADLYDDKIKQAAALAQHMPATSIFTDATAARDFAQAARYPFISKASEGAASKNVRLIASREQAEAEARAAFGRGVAISYNRLQKGYVLWQEFIEGNDRDYRVCVADNEYFGLVRRNRPDLPFASGSGDNYPLTLADERERAALAKAVQITAELGTRLMAYDFVFADDDIYLLEISSSWTPQAYATAPCFTADGQPTGRTGGHLFDLIARALC